MNTGRPTLLKNTVTVHLSAFVFVCLSIIGPAEAHILTTCMYVHVTSGMLRILASRSAHAKLELHYVMYSAITTYKFIQKNCLFRPLAPLANHFVHPTMCCMYMYNVRIYMYCIHVHVYTCLVLFVSEGGLLIFCRGAGGFSWRWISILSSRPPALEVGTRGSKFISLTSTVCVWVGSDVGGVVCVKSMSCKEIGRMMWWQLQNGSAHIVGASYSGLYEEGEVEHINCGIGPNL